MSDKLFKCPACDHEFRRRNHAACPSCGAILKDVAVMRTKAGTRSKRLETMTVVADPQQPEVVAAHLAKNTPPAPQEPKIGALVSNPGEIPNIYYLGTEGRTNARTGETRQVRRYRVEYVGILYTGWVQCPHCWRNLYKNQMMDTGAFQQEVQCKDCGTISTFIFQSNRIPYRY